uniref:Large ribosomal subunit protein mL49 n=1 Tax=Salarias fasciatus TaxID=181472 RepID=A0A672HB98_SALFA
MLITGFNTRQRFVESAEEYRFVERLIPPSRIPVPPKHAGPAPSGWIPPADNPPPLPYMVRRSRMHNIPVYTDRPTGTTSGLWTAHAGQRGHMTIKVKGHFDTELKDWLAGKGF